MEIGTRVRCTEKDRTCYGQTGVITRISEGGGYTWVYIALDGDHSGEDWVAHPGEFEVVAE